MLVSVPLALCAAIYLSEYAPQNLFTNLIRLAMEVLSSLPLSSGRPLRLLSLCNPVGS